MHRVIFRNMIRRPAVLHFSVLCGFALAGPIAAEPGNDVGSSEADPIEEIVVQRVRPKGFIVTPDTISSVYSDRRKGAYFYRIGKYKEAYPYLLNAAQRGFKMSQARLGFLYLTGLGEVPQNNVAAIGWLGVASKGRTTPDIRSFFNDMRAQIPGPLVAQAEEVIASYDASFGTKVNRVSCHRSRRTGTHIKTLRCSFDDEYRALEPFLAYGAGSASQFGRDPSPSVEWYPAWTR